MVTAYKTSDILTPANPDRSLFYNEQLALNNIVQSWMSSLPIVTTSISTDLPINIPARESFTGYLVGAYGELFYNRVLLEPTIINLGRILFETTRGIAVFNAYFEDNLLSNIFVTGDDTGITLDDSSTPVTYKPIQEQTLVFTISMDGPETFNVSYTFDFNGTKDDLIVILTGQRASESTLYPFPYGKLTESLLWSTDVIPSYNGKEQRIRGRKSPRQSLKIKSYIEPRSHVLIENLLFQGKAGAWAITIWQEQSQVDLPISFGSSRIDVDTRYGDFRVGEGILVFESITNYGLFTIETIDVNHIIIVGSFDTTFSTQTLIVPVRIGLMTSNSTRDSTGYNASINATFEVQNNVDNPSGPLTHQYNDIDVLLDIPDKPDNSTFPNTYDHRQDIIDYITGPIKSSSPLIRGTSLRKIQYTFEDLESIWNFRRILHRFAGRAIPFYMPTFEENIKLISTGLLPDSFTGISDGIGLDSETRKDIIFFLKNGQYLFREIINIDHELDGTVGITVSTIIDVDASEVDRICFLPLCRLNSDQVQIEWSQNFVSVINLSIREIVQ